MVTAVSELSTKSLRNWSPTWWAAAERGSTRSSGKPHLTPRNGAPSSKQQRDACQADRNSVAQNGFCPPVPEQLLDGLRDRFWSAEQAPREPTNVQRIQPVPEQNERGRRHDDRGGRGERDSGDTRVGERLQKVHREQHHDRHRQRDRGRGEQHGAARRRHGSNDRVLTARTVGQLVAVPADHQQRVVDRQGQAHGGGQVERKDGDVGGEGDRPQYRKGAQNRHAADRHRQRRGQQATEHPDQHQEAQRNCDRLHQQQVVLRLVGDLHVDHRDPARPHGDAVAIVRHLLGQLLGILLLVSFRCR